MNNNEFDKFARMHQGQYKCKHGKNVITFYNRPW